MKTLLLLLLTCLPLCAATTYPMLSDTTNRTVVGGVTNMSFLNSNSVFTGTARWMGIVTLTNTGNIFVGDGSGLTGVGIVTSGGLATNATIYGLTINTGSTNNALTGSRAMVTDANKGIVSSATTATELGFVSGVTSALQTQIDAKAATTTLGGYVTNLGGLATNLTATGLTVATGQTNTHLTASSVVVTDANKGIISSATTATELGYVSGVTSAIQTQINDKAATSTLGGYVTNLGGLATNLTATGLTVATGQTNTHLTASSIVTTDANKGLVSGTTTADLATLSANQTFTGTNTFSVTPSILGYRRVLFQSNTNSFLASVAVIPVVVPTNSGDFALVTPIFEITLPPLLSSKSMLHLVSLPNIRTNVNAVAGNLVFYVGTNTNCIALFTANLATTVGKSRSTSDSLIMADGSSTSQHINFSGTGTVIATVYPSNYCGDTSQPWKFYVGAYCTSAYTNINYPTIVIEESTPQQ